MRQLLSVSQYANIVNKDVGNIRRMLLSNRLKGRKIGSRWVIDSNTPYPKDSRVKNGEYINIRNIRALYSKKELMSLLKEMCARFEYLYKDDLKAIIVYGSYARNEETDDSDIDIALMVNNSIKKRRNLMVAIVGEYELLIGKTISAIEIEEERYNEWNNIMPFYKNLKKEGIFLWKQK